MAPARNAKTCYSFESDCNGAISENQYVQILIPVFFNEVISAWLGSVRISSGLPWDDLSVFGSKGEREQLASSPNEWAFLWIQPHLATEFDLTGRIETIYLLWAAQIRRASSAHSPYVHEVCLLLLLHSVRPG